MNSIYLDGVRILLTIAFILLWILDRRRIKNIQKENTLKEERILVLEQTLKDYKIKNNNQKDIIDADKDLLKSQELLIESNNRQYFGKLKTLGYSYLILIRTLKTLNEDLLSNSLILEDLTNRQDVTLKLVYNTELNKYEISAYKKGKQDTSFKFVLQTKYNNEDVITVTQLLKLLDKSVPVLTAELGVNFTEIKTEDSKL